MYVISGLPHIGATELIILLTVTLLFFGAKRISELARSLGKGTREFRNGASENTDAPREQNELPEDEKGADTEGVSTEQEVPS
jgi:sec-independent protein translocase protein TatA